MSLYARLRRALRVRRFRMRRALYRGTGNALQSAWRDARCTFVLSTGRTGTATLTELFDHVPGVTAVHEPNPELLQERMEARHAVAEDPERFRTIFARSRGLRLLKAHRAGHHYVETSARLTFFAPVIYEQLPNARFLFVHREPWDVVRSGMRRGWYRDHPNDPVRIRPVPGEAAYDGWNEMSQFEQICWYWAAYNRFALDFYESVGGDRVLMVRATDLFTGAALPEIFSFMGLNLPAEKVLERELKAQHNAQHAAHFPEADAWTDEQREALRRYAGPEMARLGYALPA